MFAFVTKTIAKKTTPQIVSPYYITPNRPSGRLNDRSGIIKMTGRRGNMKIFFQNPIALCGIIANFALSHIYTVEQRNSYQWQRSLIYIYINIVSPAGSGRNTTGEAF